MALSVTLQNGGAPYSAEADDTTFTTGAFTTSNNSEVWVIWLIQHDGGSTAPSPTWSNSQSLTRDDVVSITNGAVDYSCAVYVHRYKVTTGASTTLTASGFTTAFGNIYAYVYLVTGQDTTDSRGGTASGVAGASDGAFNLTLSSAPDSADYTLEALIGTLNSGLGSIDQNSTFTEDFDSGRDSWNKRNVSHRTGSTSTSAGWDDVSNNSSPVSWYHNPVGAAFTIKAAAGGGGTINTKTVSDTLSVADAIVQSVTRFAADTSSFVIRVIRRLQG